MKTTVIVATLVLAASVTLLRADAATRLEVKPGPSAMSPDELAIAADVAKDAQHGVILVEETDSNDDKGTTSETAYHMRAKILSPEGRALANVAIFVERGASDLKSWWGRTLLPDGRVIDLPESELKEQSIEKSASGEYRELKGALPGVVPGCVIDYGYVVRHEGFSRSTRVFLEKEWPVRSFRYHWVPNHYRPAAYATSRTEGRAIDVKHDGKSVLVTALNLDPVPEEPHMPPLDEARASATFYYTTNDNAAEFWETEAKRVEAATKLFLGNNGAVKDALESMPIPPGGLLTDKLRAAYEWLGANVKNTMLLSAEEEEARTDQDNDPYNAKTVLKAREASPRQLDNLFAGMARALGAQASIVFAVDRTDRLWNKSLKSMGQFSYTFVAVRAPGEPDDRLVFVDPGSGLPYGQVPWRATGAAALMCTAKGSAAVVVPPAGPADNRADTQVTLSFAEGNDTLLAKWSRSANGSTGLEYRRWLRALDTRKRTETLDRLCGASGRTEVTAAELPGLDETAGPFRIACDVELSEMNVGEGVAWYSLALGGPWWPDVPDFPSPKRVHPVIFDYPRVEIVGIDVSAPHGFKPKDPPATVTLESPYGRYQLFFTKTPGGFHVDRAFALTVLLVKTGEYGALRKFFDDVRKADRTTVAFERDRSTE